MSIQKDTLSHSSVSWKERGVLSVWVLHEAWLFSMEEIEKLHNEKKITAAKKRRLESKYTSYYEKSRPQNLKSAEDILEIEENARKMTGLLADLGVDPFKKLSALF